MEGVNAIGMRPSAPAQLAPSHNLDPFTNGRHPALDDWLKQRARFSEGLSARTYVVCSEADSARVVGYHAISAAKEQRNAFPTAKLRRGMPDDVPILLLARLAVDVAWGRRGIGYTLLVDAMQRSLAAAAIVGARAVIAHAIDDEAAHFYARYGFIRSSLGERVMIMPLETARVLLRESGE